MNLLIAARSLALAATLVSNNLAHTIGAKGGGHPCEDGWQMQTPRIAEVRFVQQLFLIARTPFRGVRGGQAHGSSDRIGAYPLDGRARPEDLTATIFHCLGYTPETEYRDPLGRPHPTSRGDVLHAVLS